MIAQHTPRVPRLFVSHVTVLLLGLAIPAIVWGEDKMTPSRPELTCTSGTHCGIRVVDPTTAYHSLAEIFVTTKKDRSCIPVPVVAAAFGLNAEAMDEDAVRSALVDAYWRQRNFGEDAKLPSLIFYTDDKGTRKPLDAHTVRGLMATELLAGQPKIVAMKTGKNASCVLVDSPAASAIKDCLNSASENSPPADACKSGIEKIHNDLGMPQLANLLGTIRIDGQDIKIDPASLAHIIPRSRDSQGSSLGGDTSQPGCVVQFGVTIPAITEQEVETLDVRGTSVTEKSAVYSCSPDSKNPIQIRTAIAQYEKVEKHDCTGMNFGWYLSDTVLAKDTTQPFAFLISIPSADTAPVPFEVHLEIATKPRPGGGDPQMASWKLSGACTR